MKSRRDQPLVLVVEDYQDAREMYAAYLQFSGYEVAEATNGIEAIEKAQRLMPDIILMDLALPRMDGWEATRRLKSDERTRKIPVVALTSAVAVALAILQLRHSWPSRGIARPRGWPATLFLQAVLTYALIPLTGWHPLINGILGGYGYLWWIATDREGKDPLGLPLGAYTAAGNGGRYITIFPAQNLVVAVQPDERDNQPPVPLYADHNAYSLLLRQLLDAVG